MLLPADGCESSSDEGGQWENSQCAGIEMYSDTRCADALARMHISLCTSSVVLFDSFRPASLLRRASVHICVIYASPQLSSKTVQKKEKKEEKTKIALSRAVCTVKLIFIVRVWQQ
jgi:hypothetical protein